MTMLWCGGEDVDFPNGSAFTLDATAGRSRVSSGYCRGALAQTSGSQWIKSNIFPGGEITSGWMSCQFWILNSTKNRMFVGFGKSGTTKALMFGTSVLSDGKAAVYTYDGASKTQLASEAGTSLSAGTLYKIDIHLTNYGASSHVTVYVNGAASPIIDADVDSSIAGVSGFDSVFTYSDTIGPRVSEIIVDTVDTRTASLMTLAPSGAGDSSDWTGASTDIDEINTSDADLIYDNTVGHVFLCALNDVVAGTFQLKGVKITARAQKTADATPTKLGIGVKTNTSNDLDSGHTLADLTWQSHERLMVTNPVTTSVWNTTEINDLQLALSAVA